MSSSETRWGRSHLTPSRNYDNRTTISLWRLDRLKEQLIPEDETKVWKVIVVDSGGLGRQ
jgi:hypothetical protein